jgi:hypothetical protein
VVQARRAKVRPARVIIPLVIAAALLVGGSFAAVKFWPNATTAVRNPNPAHQLSRNLRPPQSRVPRRLYRRLRVNPSTLQRPKPSRPVREGQGGRCGAQARQDRRGALGRTCGRAKGLPRWRRLSHRNEGPFKKTRLKVPEISSAITTLSRRMRTLTVPARRSKVRKPR